jgi:16S rRNA pseudouridine516 synthase
MQKILKSRLLTAQNLLFTQGFGTRHECTGLIVQGDFGFQGQALTDPFLELVVSEGADYSVKGEAWNFHTKGYIAMHKPSGFECSKKPLHHPSVYALMPTPLRVRDMQAVGRLDEDTTGLLLFSDDGQFIHKVTSPKHKAAKIYVVTLKHPGTAQQVAELLKGVTLNDSPKPVSAAHAKLVDDHHLELSLTEGKYHQVKRMVAAVGNRCEALHRSAIGEHLLRTDCPPRSWYWLTVAELAELGFVAD